MTLIQMPRYKRIHDVLTTQCDPVFMSIVDESSLHQVPKYAESHFKLILVSQVFSGLSRVDRHRKVNTLLAEELATGLHALSLALYTPEEWEAQPLNRASPACQHRKD